MLTDHQSIGSYCSIATRREVSGQPVCETVFRPGEIRPVDEFANFVTHGTGFLLSLGGAAYLVSHALYQPSFWLSISCVIYSVTLVLLYGASTLSHAFTNPLRRRYYRTLDQACIFLLIAGSYTPFAAAFLTSGFWPLLTVSMWALALTGAFLVFRWGYLSATAQKLYVAMGWFPAICIPAIIAHASPDTTFWVIIGGVLYTVGTFFLWYDSAVRYFHATWHVMVIGGSLAHFLAIVSLLS